MRSGVLEIKEKIVRFIHEMRNDTTGEVAAIMVLTAVHFNTQEKKILSVSKRYTETRKKFNCTV